MNIPELLDQLDQLEDTVTLDDLRVLLNQLEVSYDDVCDGVEFCDDRYERNLLRRTDHYEALLLCFEPGQRTAVHDHAGSACGVRVIEGEATETIFEPTEDGWLFATGSSRLSAGGVVGSVDMDIHQLSNLQPAGKRLITLHIYSPPLGKVGNYCIEDNTVSYVLPTSRECSLA